MKGVGALVHSRRSRSEDQARFGISFEFFPPHNEAGAAKLIKTAERLSLLQPDFASVTYGAGGSTKGRTLKAVQALKTGTDLTIAGHLTCAGAPRAEVDQMIDAYRQNGVRHVVALRGDPPEGIGTRYRPHSDGYSDTADLIRGLRRADDFTISVSAYPERHPESVDWQTDLDVMKRKIDAGADRAITQFFFDNDLFEVYLERVRAAGITIPIVPGILPIYNFETVMTFAAKCGTSLPHWLAARFAGLDRDPETRMLVSSAVAAEQVLDLVDRGIDTFHFYTMNRADLVYAICHLLGRRPQKAKKEAA